MIEQFIEYMDTREPLSNEEAEFIRAHMPVVTYKRGEYLLREGEVSDRFFFMLDGFVRLYYNVDGEDVTAYFYPEGVFVSAYESYLRGTPAVQNFQAVEDTVVGVITKEAADNALQCFPNMMRVAIAAMEEELVHYQRIIASLLTQIPEQRYLKLLNEHGDYFNRIPQRHIASYIGVKPESLSRIKKRVQEQLKS